MDFHAVYGWVHAHLGNGARQALLFGSLAALTLGVVVAGRAARRRGTAAARRMDRAWGTVLICSWVLLIVNGWSGGPINWGNVLPLHICAVVSLAAAVAQWTHWRPARAICVLWGLGLSCQTFMAGMEVGALTRLSTYVFWGYHEVNVAAAAYLLFVQRYRPTWRDWQLSARAGVVYVCIVWPLDVLLNADYGMIGPQVTYPPIGWFGPWPLRVVWLFLTCNLITAIVTLAWRRNWPNRSLGRESRAVGLSS